MNFESEKIKSGLVFEMKQKTKKNVRILKDFKKKFKTQKYWNVSGIMSTIFLTENNSACFSANTLV
jgi:hypothetical protein